MMMKMESNSIRQSKGRGSNDSKSGNVSNSRNTKITSTTATTTTTTTTSRANSLRKLEAAFLILIAIFLSLSIFVNFIHEFDIYHLGKSQVKTTLPQFHGVTFQNFGRNGSGASASNKKNKQKGGLVTIVHDTKIVKKDVAVDPNRDKQANAKQVINKEKIKAEEHKPKYENGKKLSTSAIMTDEQHKLGGLSCSAFGGPSDDIAEEMIYWKDIPSDAVFESPFKQKKKDGPVQYMTFEPDGGGWNNIRCVFRIV